MAATGQPCLWFKNRTAGTAELAYRSHPTYLRTADSNVDGSFFTLKR
jgi:hypothetical protein